MTVKLSSSSWSRAVSLFLIVAVFGNFPKVYHRVQTNTLLDSVLRQFNEDHTLTVGLSSIFMCSAIYIYVFVVVFSLYIPGPHFERIFSPHVCYIPHPSNTLVLISVF